MSNNGTTSKGGFFKPDRNILSHPTAVQALQEETPFRYTLNNNRLTYAQRQFYEDNGFLVIPRLIDDQALDNYAKRFDDICEGRVPKGQMTVMRDVSYVKAKKDGLNTYYKIQDINYDEVFFDYIGNPKLLDYVEAFTGPHITAKHSMLINKPPDSGTLSSRHPPHQDLYYFSFRPVDRIVACWTAMEKVNAQNGCLYVVPGTHKGELLPHGYPQWEGGVNKAFHGIQDYDVQSSILVEMEKGDTVFFHPLLIHGSGPNLTKGFRKAISCHYSLTDCYYIDVVGTLQEEIAKEVEEIARKRGFKMDYTEFWEIRSRHVRGPKSKV